MRLVRTSLHSARYTHFCQQRDFSSLECGKSHCSASVNTPFNKSNSSVKQPIEQIGQTALQLMLERITHPTGLPAKYCWM